MPVYAQNIFYELLVMFQVSRRKSDKSFRFFRASSDWASKPPWPWSHACVFTCVCMCVYVCEKGRECECVYVYTYGRNWISQRNQINASIMISEPTVRALSCSFQQVHYVNYLAAVSDKARNTRTSVRVPFRKICSENVNWPRAFKDDKSGWRSPVVVSTW